MKLSCLYTNIKNYISFADKTVAPEQDPILWATEPNNETAVD